MEHGIHAEQNKCLCYKINHYQKKIYTIFKLIPLHCQTLYVQLHPRLCEEN